MPKRNFLITGRSGAGKSTLASTIAAPITPRLLVLDHLTRFLPTGQLSKEVLAVKLDEVPAHVLVAGLSIIESWLFSGVRLVIVTRIVAELPPEVVHLLQTFGGVQHIQLNPINDLGAELEVIPLSASAQMWQEILTRMKGDKRKVAAARILNELSASVADADLSDADRAALNVRIGLLASAVHGI